MVVEKIYSFVQFLMWALQLYGLALVEDVVRAKNSVFSLLIHAPHVGVRTER